MVVILAPLSHVVSLKVTDGKENDVTFSLQLVDHIYQALVCYQCNYLKLSFESLRNNTVYFKGAFFVIPSNLPYLYLQGVSLFSYISLGT